MNTLGVLGLSVLLASTSLAARARPVSDPDAIPDAPFKTVHFIKATPVQAAALASAAGDLNRALARDGCSTCAYHVFRLYSGPPTQFDYMMTADWPGRAEYLRLHGSPGYSQVSRRNPILSDLSGGEIYGRYVEVK